MTTDETVAAVVRTLRKLTDRIERGELEVTRLHVENGAGPIPDPMIAQEAPTGEYTYTLEVRDLDKAQEYQQAFAEEAGRRTGAPAVSGLP